MVAQGGRFGGWSLYVVGGVPHYAYNFVGRDLTVVRGGKPMAPGRHDLVVRFDYDGGPPGSGADVTLEVDGRAVGSGRIPVTTAYYFSFDETFNVGVDRGTPGRRRLPAGAQPVRGADPPGALRPGPAGAAAATRSAPSAPTPAERLADRLRGQSAKNRQTTDERRHGDRASSSAPRPRGHRGCRTAGGEPLGGPHTLTTATGRRRRRAPAPRHPTPTLELAPAHGVPALAGARRAPLSRAASEVIVVGV